MGLVTLILFILVMGVWLLALLGAVDGLIHASPWLPFFACLLLGIGFGSYGYGYYDKGPPPH
jgi:hypothetical protein